MGLNISIVQQSPVHLDLQASLDLALCIIEKEKDSDLIIFGETWLTGYPAWMDYAANLNRWNDQRLKNVYSKLLLSSPKIDGNEIRSIRHTANKHNSWIIMGIHEKCASSKSLHNSIIGISDEGEVVFHHRKMVPTFTEKLIHKPAEKFDLKTIDIGGFKVGSLICWEHWMPLARQFYHDQNEEIHIALWPEVNEIHQIASRHYAFEGRCYVIAVGQHFLNANIPSELVDSIQSSDSLLRGGSCVVKPNGEFLLKPIFEGQDIVRIAIQNKDLIYQESLTMDVSGHYARKDLFDFKVK